MNCKLNIETIVVHYVAQLFIIVRLLKCRFGLNCVYEIKVDIIHFKEWSIVQVAVSNIDVRRNEMNYLNVQF